MTALQGKHPPEPLPDERAWAALEEFIAAD